MKVRDVMSEEPVCCTPDESAKSAAQKLRDHDIGAVPVVNSESERRLEGMVTDRDLCCRVLAESKDAEATKVRDCMTSRAVSVGEEAELDDCADMMQQHQVRRIPVVDEAGCCVGVVAQADLARQADSRQVKQTVSKISPPPAP